MLLDTNLLNGLPSLFCSTSNTASTSSTAVASTTTTNTNPNTIKIDLSNVINTLISDFINSFTIDTWGLSLTLSDFPFVIGILL